MRELVARRLAGEPVEGTVEADEGEFVALGGGAFHPLGEAEELAGLFGAGPGGGEPGEQALHFTADGKQAELLVRVDRGDHHPLTGQDPHQPLAGEPLQRLAYRGAAEPGALTERGLGDDGAGGKAQRHDLFLEPPVGPLGERMRRGQRREVGEISRRLQRRIEGRHHPPHRLRTRTCDRARTAPPRLRARDSRKDGRWYRG